MKTVTFTMLLSILALFSMAQDSANSTFNIKDYSLRDYVAPDIKYNRFDIGSNFSGNGSQSGDYRNNSFTGNLRFGLYTYRNNDGFQGSSNNSFDMGYYANWNKQDSNKGDYQQPSIGISHYGINRWYNKNDRFIGVHPSLRGRFDYSNNRTVVDTINQNNHYERQYISSSIVISVGTGRIQPVRAARQAMDILISLEKYNRLSKNPTSSQVDSLAKIANSISYKRFYDRRFKRIYQLAELDKGIQKMGLVENPDMIYAANLSDIWSYGTSYSRGSGSRFEVGVIPSFNHNNGESRNDVSNSRQLDYGYGISGVASWTKQVPLSFIWQSDFSVSLDYRVHKSEYRDFRLYSYDRSITSNSESLIAKWSLGYFPNTRTWLRLSPFVKFSAVQQEEEIENMEPEDEEFFGMATGLDFRAEYYISPRFRLGLTAGTSFVSDNYINSMPDYRLGTVNWGESYYSKTNTSGNNIANYQYRLNITYAIF